MVKKILNAVGDIDKNCKTLEGTDQQRYKIV
jgi:hypothetical protein